MGSAAVLDLVETCLRANKKIGNGDVKEAKIPGQKRQESLGTELRMAVDYITVNKQTSKVQYPIQPIKRILSRLRGTHVVSSIDIRKAFWNIELDDVSRKIFAFEGCEKSFVMHRLPMGSSASQQILSSCLQESLAGCEMFATNYSDNILVFSQNEEDHLVHLDKTIGALAKYGWKFSPEKSHFVATTSIIIFGFQLNLKDGSLRADPDKVTKIKNMVPPTDRKGVRRFLGSILYFIELLPNIGKHLTVIQEKLKIAKQFVWDTEAQEAFDKVKNALSKEPYVILPDFDKDFHCFVDAGPSWIGGGIFQYADDIKGLLPVSWHTKKLSAAELNYSQYEKEALGIVSILKTHVHILKFGFTIIYTDCKGLTFIKAFSTVNQRMGRWTSFINGFPHRIQWVPSTTPLTQLVDMMSRQSVKKFVSKKPTKKEIDDFPFPDFSEKVIWNQKEYNDFIERHLQQIKFSPIKYIRNGNNKIRSSLITTKQINEEEQEQMCLDTIDLHDFCHVCNVKEDIYNEAEDLEEPIQDIDEQRSDRSTDLDRYSKDTSPEGRLIHATFKETAVLSVRRLRKLQQEENKLKEIIISLSNGEDKFCDKYALKDDVLLKKRQDRETQEVTGFQIVIPAILAPMLIWAYHSSIYAGHPTAKKLVRIISERFFIDNLKHLCLRTV